MSLAYGIRAFFDGARAARTRGLRRYTWLPALVSFLIIAAGLMVTFGYIDELIAWVTARLPGWLDFLSLVLTPLLYLFGILVGAWLFGFLAALIASPFLGDLSLAVERIEFAGGPPEPPGFWHGALGAIGRELRKLGYHLPRLLAAFLLTLVPVINIVAPLIWFAFGAWAMAVEFCDYPTENRGRPFQDTVALLKRHRGAAFGYGACATVAFAIPLVNFLFVPVAVAGGTILWRRLEGRDHPPRAAAPQRPH